VEGRALSAAAGGSPRSEPLTGRLNYPAKLLYLYCYSYIFIIILIIITIIISTIFSIIFYFL
jgi:hypothetical protein